MQTCSICKQSQPQQHFLNKKNRVLKSCARCRDKSKKRKERAQHTCQECGKACQSPAALLDHINGIHKKERNYKCDQCDMSYTNSSNLNRHKRAMHLNERSHKCDLCDAAFNGSDSLEKHNNAVHIKLKPFECEVCYRAFASKGKLTRHVKQVHEKEKSHRCEQCEYKCNTGSNLRRHVKTVHEDVRPFVCDGCGYAAAANYVLQHHKTYYCHQGKIKGCSGGECKIIGALREVGLDFAHDARHGGLRSFDSKGYLRFDFVIEHPKGVHMIEFDGQQHFENKGNWCTDNKFERLQKNDKAKNWYCEEHNYPLLRIRYDCPNVESKVLETLTEWGLLDEN